MSELKEAGLNEIRDQYDGGECPDCGRDVPRYAKYEEACRECGHVWNRVQGNDNVG